MEHETNGAYVIVAYLRFATSAAKTMAARPFFSGMRRRRNERVHEATNSPRLLLRKRPFFPGVRRMRSKGHVYVVAESLYSDRPRIPMNPHASPVLPTSYVSYQHALAFNPGGHGTVLYVFGRPCTMEYAPGREYAFMEPRERWCGPLPITERTHNDRVRRCTRTAHLRRGLLMAKVTAHPATEASSS